MQTATYEHLLCATFTFGSAGDDDPNSPARKWGLTAGWPPSEQQPGSQPGASLPFFGQVWWMGPQPSHKASQVWGTAQVMLRPSQGPSPKLCPTAVQCGLAARPWPPDGQELGHGRQALAELTRAWSWAPLLPGLSLNRLSTPAPVPYPAPLPSLSWVCLSRMGSE